MDEKIIIQSERKNLKPFCIGMPIAAAVIFFLTLIVETIIENNDPWNKGETMWQSFLGVLDSYGYVWLIALSVPVLAIAGYIIYKGWSQIELTVSNKRVYGTAAFGKRVDLPIDAISAIGTSIFNGIAITTASGAIKFFMINNRDDIHKEVSKLLVERQSKPVATTTIKQEIPQSNADELRKYKELLDSGIISQEEFDSKKKQLLGL